MCYFRTQSEEATCLVDEMKLKEIDLFADGSNVSRWSASSAVQSSSICHYKQLLLRILTCGKFLGLLKTLQLIA